MKNILADFATDIALCKTDDCAWGVGERFFESLGFESATYGVLDKKTIKLLVFILIWIVILWPIMQAVITMRSIL